MNINEYILALKEYKKQNEELLEEIQNPPKGMVYISSDPNDIENIKGTIQYLERSIKHLENLSK
jgi:type II secretory pathway component GspD/PulD (secretin)